MRRDSFHGPASHWSFDLRSLSKYITLVAVMPSSLREGTHLGPEHGAEQLASSVRPSFPKAKKGYLGVALPRRIILIHSTAIGCSQRQVLQCHDVSINAPRQDPVCRLRDKALLRLTADAVLPACVIICDDTSACNSTKSILFLFVYQSSLCINEIYSWVDICLYRRHILRPFPELVACI